MAEEFEPKGENAWKGHCWNYKEGIDKKFLWILCETYCAVIQGKALPARGAPSQH